MRAAASCGLGKQIELEIIQVPKSEILWKENNDFLNFLCIVFSYTAVGFDLKGRSYC